MGDEEASHLLLVTSLIEISAWEVEETGGTWNVALPTRVNSNRGWERGHLDPRAPLRKSGGAHLVKAVKGGGGGRVWVGGSLRKLRNFL